MAIDSKYGFQPGPGGFAMVTLPWSTSASYTRRPMRSRRPRTSRPRLSARGSSSSARLAASSARAQARSPT
eukprot:3063899-Rhodomonas_salina.1